MKQHFRRISALVAFGGCVALGGAAEAVVLHPADAGVPLGSRPSDLVVGRWGSNGSAVAIAPNYILTVRHTSGNTADPNFDIGTSVVFGATTYSARESTFIPGVDLRVVRITQVDGITPANLGTVAPLYTIAADGSESLKSSVIGSYGQGRGTAYNDGTSVGYNWDGSANTTLRWGGNRVESFANVSGFGFTSNSIVADFDGPSALPADFADAHEAGVALFDSGSGWFIFSGGQWKVAGITLGLSHQLGTAAASTSIYSPQDSEFAIRVSTYSNQINAAVPEPATAGMLGIVAVGLLARRSRRRRADRGPARRTSLRC